MEKHQIGIVAALLALVALCVFLAINALSDDSSKDYYQAEANYNLPIVPSNENEDDQFTTKLDQVQDKEEEIKKRKWAEANKSEIDLDVFGFDDKKDEVISQPIEEPEPKPVYKPKKKKPRPRLEVVQEKANTVPPVEQTEPLTDPDLQFFGNSSNQNTSSISEEKKILIYAVIHDQVAVSTGQRLTIRTTKEFRHNGKVLPRNTFLHAIVNFSNNRVQLALPSIKFRDGSYLQKRLIAYDGNDDNIGLYAPKLLENTATNDAADGLMDEVEDEINNSLIKDVVSGLGKKKLKERAIPIKRNHPIILKEQ